jgi:hypothetical protein
VKHAPRPLWPWLTFDVGQKMATGPTIFYSWQSDTPAEVSRSYIRSCLDEAAKSLQVLSAVEEAPRVDSGMEGISGTPEVASVMFDKIAAASIFVGDVTLVATADAMKKRRSPNSNVSIEMGFAAGVLGWSRVICVMNEAFGSRFDLPFDHRNRRFPITYTRKPGGEAKPDDLTASLIVALQTAEAAEFQKVDRALQRLDLSCLRLIYAYRHVAYFSEPMLFSPEKVYEDLFPKAVPRLLDLGLLVAHMDGQKSLYAYHWTYLGQKVIERLKPRF